MIDLKKEIQFVKGVGPTRVQLLNKLGIYTLEDLITYYPREYEDRSKPKYIDQTEDGEEVLISAYPMGRMNEIRIRGNLMMSKLMVQDETAGCQLVWYNQPYLKNRFRPNKRYKFYGKIKMNRGKREMQSPVFEEVESSKNTGKIIPIYPLTYRLSQNTLRKIMENAVTEVGRKIARSHAKIFHGKISFV